MPAGRLLGFAGGKLPVADHALTLKPGDTLLLFTDGVTEATTAERAKMYGLERLMAALSELPEDESLENWSDRIRTTWISSRARILFSTTSPFCCFADHMPVRRPEVT